MEPSENRLAEALKGLGEDLLLLSIRSRDGVITTISRINYGLMGSELIRLAAMGRVSVDKRQITVLSQVPTGDEQLDAALTSLANGKPQRPRTWVGHPRRGIRDEYLERLVRAGVLRSESIGRLGRKRWVVPPSRRADQARERLDAIAYSTGSVDLAQSAFGGLAHAVNLDGHLYPKFADRRLRRRLREVGSGQWTQDVADAVSAAASAATDAATRAATEAAMRAAVDASTAAAISAASSPPAGETAHHHH
jgi:Golgi phosphoprotein 3 (GPP34)